MSAPLDCPLAPPSDVVFRDVNGEAVILHLGTSTYFGLDDIGTRIWQLAVDGRTVREICSTLPDEFDAPAGQIERDVVALVEQLLSKDLLRAAS
jgi:hypothetical protein